MELFSIPDKFASKLSSSQVRIKNYGIKEYTMSILGKRAKPMDFHLIEKLYNVLGMRE